MKDEDNTKEQLINELTKLRKRVALYEEKEAEYKRTAELLRESEERFDLAMKGSADGLWDWKVKTGEAYWSPQCKQLMGYQDHEIESSFQKWASFLHPDDQKRVLDALTNHIEKHSLFHEEYKLKTKKGDYRWFLSCGQALWDEEGKAIRMVGSIRDITDRKKMDVELKASYQNLEAKIAQRTADLRATNKKLKKIINEQKQAEATLKKSEEKYYKLIEQANDAIISINSAGIIISFNGKAETMFGYSREEMLGKPSYLLVAQENRENQNKLLKKFAETGNGLESGKNILEGRGVTKEGKEFHVEYSFYSLEFYGETISTASIRDISERKRSDKKIADYQKRLKALTSQITFSEEKERRNFAVYLHDEIGQYLFASQIQLEQLIPSSTSAENAKTLEKILNNIKQTISNSRSLTFELSSPILHELGLEKALEWLVEHTYKQYNILVALDIDKQEKPLDDDIKIFLYQAVRELLTNVAKHAKTQNASVSVEKENSNIRICVKDNGVGFNPPNEESSEDKTKGFGLFSISERLEQLGGQLDIESHPNSGTNIALVAPLCKSGDSF